MCQEALTVRSLNALLAMSKYTQTFIERSKPLFLIRNSFFAVCSQQQELRLLFSLTYHFALICGLSRLRHCMRKHV
jgi:hypothetical protein